MGGHTVAGIIREMTETYITRYPDVETASDINSGRCIHFAEDVADVIGPEAAIIEAVGDGTAHGWIKWNGRVYDSEAPSGVDSWCDLPHFTRWGGDEITVISTR